MLNFRTISKIFSDFFSDALIAPKSEDELIYLIRLNIEINQKLWDFEDLARMIEFGSEHIATTKQEIDKNNQIRNDLIKKIDTEIKNQMQITPLDFQEQFYSESPGMVIDRIAILFIKLSVIHKLLSVIKEEDLKKDYKEKENVVLKQISRIGNFLDLYFYRLKNKEIFFEVQQPVKIYNDSRVKKYIKLLQKPKNNL